MLSAETLDLLRQWWKARRSRHDEQTPVQERWLFPGTRPGRPMTTRLLERGTDIRIIQALLGHDKLDTTARYTRVATGMIASIKSPLDVLSQPRKKPGKSARTLGGLGRASTWLHCEPHWSG